MHDRHIYPCANETKRRRFFVRARVRVCSGKPKRSASICSVPSPYSNVWCARMLYKLYSITCSAHILLRLDAYISWGLQESHCCHFDVAHIDFFFLGFIVGFSLKTCIRFLRSYGIWLWCCTVFVLCSVCVWGTFGRCCRSPIYSIFTMPMNILNDRWERNFTAFMSRQPCQHSNSDSRESLCVTLAPGCSILDRWRCIYKFCCFFFSFLMYFAFLELAKYQRTPPVCVCVYIYMSDIFILLFCWWLRTVAMPFWLRSVSLLAMSSAIPSKRGTNTNHTYACI